MNVNDYTYLINRPDAISEKQTEELGNVLDEFPYFQSARAMRLKGLYSQNSFKYNYALKVTAAHTTDRAILFDFITSETFSTIQKEYYDKKALALLDINVIDSEHLLPDVVIEEDKEEEIIEVIEKVETIKIIDPIEQSILTSIKEASIPTIEVNLETTEEALETAEEAIEIATENLEIGKPLDFSVKEKHSFQQWLQLSRTEPIERKKENKEEKQEVPTIEIDNSLIEINEEKKKKEALINKFIETSPKISPVKSTTTVAANIQIDINKDDNTYLMTETLARVYLEQKKYTKAIQAYEILILKYPEKISFFADRISDIKTLQQNNNNN
ncbi:tetratricopeptide repeat protein [Flavobacterium branchiarum]|uniref:Tetratricopeptide repeat protein n=1 Tax=Flavobacterium branchiarum TaxID=1114870 RepID=A0ABV5FM00_9FLAO|nr:tetratricopeptide repeat protein [Flavobacterium branchiarum]MDN3674630.1 tetratricopeptide repeat protein [Flavobacterium branchiarum]